MSDRLAVASVSVLWLACAAFGAWSVSASPAQPQAERIYQAGEQGVVLPRARAEVKPQYTPAAMNAGIEGTMAVAAVVGTDGTVGAVQVTRSLDTVHGLDEEGLKAARQWLFQPGTKDGEPAAVRVTIEFTFTLRD